MWATPQKHCIFPRPVNCDVCAPLACSIDVSPIDIKIAVIDACRGDYDTRLVTHIVVLVRVVKFFEIKVHDGER